MPWLQDREKLQEEARTFDPSIILLPKSHWLWQVISWILFIVTFGTSKRDAFLDFFATTAGPIWGLPDQWEPYLVRKLIPHEGRHTRQARICGWFVPVLGWIPYLAPWVGLPIQLVLYALLPFPIGFAWFRFYMELDADRQEWKVKLSRSETTVSQVLDDAEYRGLEVAGKYYFYPWPETWCLSSYRKVADKVVRDFVNANDSSGQ